MTSVNSQNVDTMLSKVNALTEGQNSSNAQSVQSELETLFSEYQTMNGGDAGAEKIQKQIDALAAKIKGLEDDAQEILKDVEEKNSLINSKSNDLADTTADLTGATGDLREKTKEAANLAAREAVKKFKDQGGSAGGTNFEFIYNNAFQKHLGGLQANQNELAALYALYEQQKDGIGSIAAEIESAINQVNGLENQLKNINGTISLLTRTKNNMINSTIEGAYQNCDTDANVPIFSGQKAEFANSLLDKYSSRNEADNTQKTKTASEAKKQWSSQNTKKWTGDDSYALKSCDNPELNNLNECLENGMLEDLQASGMTNDDIMKFIKNNWNVGIKYDKDKNVWTIPKGHENNGVKKGGTAIYDKLRDFCASKTSVVGADTVNQTQMTEMKKAVEQDDILTQMYEQGFTFKEAMYTLTQLFPDAGITYDLNSQSKERNYGIVSDNSASGSLYKTMGEQILKYWNVGGTQATTKDNSVTGTTKYDPLTFQQGDTTYTFIIDRDGDGQFDYTNGDNNELLGSQGGLEEIMKYDTDGDGNLSAQEMKEAGIYVLANKQNESVDDAKDVDNYKKGPSYTNSVDFEVSYLSAEDLGISGINLNSAVAGNGSNDINGSTTLNTFQMNMTNGSTIEVKETNNTEANLETFYGQIANSGGNSSRIYSQLDKSTVEDAYNNAEGSDIIDSVKERLEELKEENAKRQPADLGISYDQINEMTGLGYLTAMMDAGRTAAENNAYKGEDTAAKASENAVDEVWQQNIAGKQDDEQTLLKEEEQKTE